MFVYKVMYEGKVVVEVVLGFKLGFDVQVILSVVYIDLEVVWVGVIEMEVCEQGCKFGKGVFLWVVSGWFFVFGCDEGMIKFFFDFEMECIVGVGVVGINVGDFIGELVLVIEMGCDVQDIGFIVYLYLIFFEMVVMVVEVFEGMIIDFYMFKKVLKVKS